MPPFTKWHRIWCHYVTECMPSVPPLRVCRSWKRHTWNKHFWSVSDMFQNHWTTSAYTFILLRDNCTCSMSNSLRKLVAGLVVSCGSGLFSLSSKSSRFSVYVCQPQQICINLHHMKTYMRHTSRIGLCEETSNCDFSSTGWIYAKFPTDEEFFQLVNHNGLVASLTTTTFKAFVKRNGQLQYRYTCINYIYIYIYIICNYEKKMNSEFH